MRSKGATRDRVEVLSVRRTQSEDLRAAIQAMYDAEEAEDPRPANEVAAWHAIRDAAAEETFNKHDTPAP